MHINQLRELINTMEAQGLTEFRCLDDMLGTSEQVVVKNVWIDSEGRIVDDIRRECAVYTPYPRDEYLTAYNEFPEDDLMKKAHSTFEEFYAMMESYRIKEVNLIQNAKQVVLIGAENCGVS